MLFGSCFLANTMSELYCSERFGSRYSAVCPSSYGWFVVLGLVLYVAFFFPDMGLVPWKINSKIYPSKYRSMCWGIAATVCWISNLIVSETFQSLIDVLGTVLAFVPETKGLSLEEVDKLSQVASYKEKESTYNEPPLDNHQDSKPWGSKTNAQISYEIQIVHLDDILNDLYEKEKEASDKVLH